MITAEVFAAIRRDADAGDTPEAREWVDLATVRHHEEGVRTALKQQGAAGAWAKKNPVVRIQAFQLTEKVHKRG